MSDLWLRALPRRRTGAVVSAVAMMLFACASPSVASGPAGPSARTSRPPSIDKVAALAILRTASDLGNPDARRMLASLVEGAFEPGDTSLRLYLSAQALGDEVARDRLDVLRLRGVSVPFSAASGDPLPASGKIVPIGRMGEELEPGYHCHFLRPGQMWCHSGLD